VVCAPCEVSGAGGAAPRGWPRIVLHLGAHKTASTHLQRSIEAREAALARRGVLYMGPRHLRQAGLRLGQVIEGGLPPVEWRRRIGRDVIGLFAAADTLVVSDENILGSAHDPRILSDGVLYPDAAARLDQALRSFRAGGVELFLGVRDPAGFVVSAYGQFLLAGGRADFHAFLNGADIARLRWTELAARLLAVPGVRGCTLWRYEDYPACLPQIMAAMLPGGQGAGVTALEERMQPGFSARAHALLRAWQAEGVAPPKDTTLAAQARARFPKASDEPSFSPFLERSAAAYGADIVRLAGLPGLNMISGVAPPLASGHDNAGADPAKDA
jgi:hypothetical protein